MTNQFFLLTNVESKNVWPILKKDYFPLLEKSMNVTIKHEGYLKEHKVITVRVAFLENHNELEIQLVPNLERNGSEEKLENEIDFIDLMGEGEPVMEDEKKPGLFQDFVMKKLNIAA